jgi:hypothetical protein
MTRPTAQALTRTSEVLEAAETTAKELRKLAALIKARLRLHESANDSQRPTGNRKSV